jgi:hypothetical protein
MPFGLNGTKKWNQFLMADKIFFFLAKTQCQFCAGGSFFQTNFGANKKFHFIPNGCLLLKNKHTKKLMKLLLIFFDIKFINE